MFKVGKQPRFFFLFQTKTNWLIRINKNIFFL